MRRSRRAITLVEVMIASCISLVLMTVLWSIFSGSIRQFFLTQRHLEAMQVAQLVLEFVENDAHAMIVEDDATPTVLGGTSPRNQLAFFVSRGDQADGGIYRGDPVSFGLAPIAGTKHFYFVRNGRTLYNMPLRLLRFEILEGKAFDSLPARPRSLHYLRTTVVAMDSDRRGSFALVGLTALELVSRRRLGRHWNPTTIDCVRVKGKP